MIVGVPKEIKVHEARVAITPEGVSEFVQAGHSVLIEDGAGLGSAITNEDFQQAGATIIREGEQGDAAYIIVAGRCDIQKDMPSGTESQYGP